MLEDLTKELLLAVLREPCVEIEYQQMYLDGNTIQVPLAKLSDSIATRWIHSHATDEDRKRVTAVAVEYLEKHPEILAERLADKYVKAFDDIANRRFDSSTAIATAVKGSVRDAAANILSQDQAFRVRVIDMAHLSDSDNINVSINLEPKKQ